MRTSRYLAEDELIRRGVEALMKALGPTETARFLNLPRTRCMESVKRHRKWQATLQRKQFFDEVFGSKKEKS